MVDPMPGDAAQTAISHDTKLTVRLTLGACALVLAMAMAWANMTALVRDIQSQLEAIKTNIQNIVVEQNGHVTRAEFRAWVREFKALNAADQSIHIPMPD